MGVSYGGIFGNLKGAVGNLQFQKNRYGNVVMTRNVKNGRSETTSAINQRVRFATARRVISGYFKSNYQSQYLSGKTKLPVWQWFIEQFSDTYPVNGDIFHNPPQVAKGLLGDAPELDFVSLVAYGSFFTLYADLFSDEREGVLAVRYLLYNSTKREWVFIDVNTSAVDWYTGGVYYSKIDVGDAMILFWYLQSPFGGIGCSNSGSHSFFASA